MIITSLLGGILMDYYGIIRAVKLCLIASLIVSIISAFLRWKFITETLEHTVIKPENVRTQQFSLKDRLVQQLGTIPRSVWILISVSSLSGFAMRNVFSFMVVYSVEIVGLTNT